jgi:hypothetical protein
MKFSEQQCAPIEPHEIALQIPKIVQERGQSTLQPKMRSHTIANRFYARLLDRPDISNFSWSHFRLFTELERKIRSEVTQKVCRRRANHGSRGYCGLRSAGLRACRRRLQPCYCVGLLRRFRRVIARPKIEARLRWAKLCSFFPQRVFGKLDGSAMDPGSKPRNTPTNVGQAQHSARAL